MHLSIEFIALLTSFDPGDYLLCVHAKFAPERNYRTTAGIEELYNLWAWQTKFTVHCHNIFLSCMQVGGYYSDFK